MKLKEAFGPARWQQWHVLKRGDLKGYNQLRRVGERFNWRDETGRDSLHIAVVGGDLEIITDLIDNCNRDINAQHLGLDRTIGGP